MASPSTSPTISSPTGKKLVKTKSGLRMINIIDDERSPFEMDEPSWKPDSEQQLCEKCGVQFSFTTRKHHCRRCGKIFCASCCTTKVNLPRLCFVDPQRVCSDCVKVSKDENELFNNIIPVLCKGAEIQINDNKELVKCKLESKLHRTLVFISGDNTASVDPILLTDITTFQCLTDPLQPTANGNGNLVGVNLKYIANSATHELKLQVNNDIKNRKESLAFLLKLQKAMMVIFYSS